MTLPAEYLRYPRRRYGMDHERYDWSILFRRPALTWPGGARVALWIVPSLEWFPLDMAKPPFPVPGAMTRAYPDYWNYTHRDYGNRVGIFRIMQALSERGLRASAAVNAAVCERYPSLIEHCAKHSWEFIVHGMHMGNIHHGDLPREQEAALVHEAVATVTRATGTRPRGWLSPAGSESMHTPELVATEGIDYLCDWINDDLPYRMRTPAGPLWAMPYSHEISDLTTIWQYHHGAAEFAEQVRDQFDTLYREAAEHGGRILAISLHPWIIGQPHRMVELERALDHVIAHAGVWPATGAEIVDAVRDQHP